MIFFFVLKKVYCVCSLESPHREYTTYLHVKENRKYIPIMPPNLALYLTLISSNFPCLEHIFMIPKVFEPLNFYCSYIAKTPAHYIYRSYATGSFICKRLACIPVERGLSLRLPHSCWSRIVNFFSTVSTQFYSAANACSAIPATTPASTLYYARIPLNTVHL